MADSISILIIEGEPNFRKKLTSVLTEVGFIIADVPDYPEALLKLGEFNPDIAIVDEVLPSGDGKEVCSRLRNVFSIPVILLGRDSTGKAWRAAVEAGADFYFTKPLSYRELAATVRAILRRYKKAAALLGRGKWVVICPIRLDKIHCQNCYFWRNGKCDYDAIMREHGRRDYGIATSTSSQRIEKGGDTC